MKILLGIGAVALAASGALVGQDTFQSVQDGFRRGVVALLHEQQVPAEELEARLGALALETFGAHPELVRREAEARLAALPAFPGGDLGAWVERTSWDPVPPIPSELEGTWLLQGWDPQRIAAWAKNMVLARELGVEEFGRRSLLSAHCADELYRHGEGDRPGLILDSLGDLFVVGVEWTGRGVCRPVSVRWLVRP